jgi:hypothetical protein
VWGWCAERPRHGTAAAGCFECGVVGMLGRGGGGGAVVVRRARSLMISRS